MKHYNKMARQAGMTLIELTVVLLILVGLAGLMIPYVGGFVSKTHDSVNSDSLASANQAIQRYDVQFMGMPSSFDSLTQDADLTTGTPFSKMMGGLGGGTDDYLKTVTVKGQVFLNAGISSLAPMDATAASATFNSTISPVTIDKADDLKLNAINVQTTTCAPTDSMGCISGDTGLADILGREVNTTANDYILLGIGQASEMIGKTMSEAPVHFAQNGAMSATNKYNRILAVYRVPVATTVANKGYCTGYDTGTTGTADATQPLTMALCNNTAAVAADTAGTWTMVMRPKAEFVTTVMPMMMLEGLGGALSSHYDSVAN